MRGRALALVAALALSGVACSATPSWIAIADRDAPAELAFVEEESATQAAATQDIASQDIAIQDTAPSEEPVAEDPPASADFCTASANIWTHSAALNLLGSEATAEMTQVAMANVAEWLERSTLFSEKGVTARAAMFAAFTELQDIAATEFDSNWEFFRSSSTYANDQAAETFETQRSALVPFINDECDGLSIRDLGTDAQARADELLADFAAAPSKVVESDALPGHSIFTHGSGRLIASFPSAWDYDEGRSDAIVDLIASKDIDRFLGGEALDGVRIQLLEAPTLQNFRTLIDETMIGTSCEQTSDRVDDGATRLNITQSYDCPDHGAAIVGQYRAASGLGLIIEASFDRPEPGNADMMRLASIANSALWS